MKLFNFLTNPSSMETISTDAPPPVAAGPALVVLICPNHGKVLGLEAHAPESCCPDVPVVRADARQVRMAPDGTCVGAVRI